MASTAPADATVTADVVSVAVKDISKVTEATADACPATPDEPATTATSATTPAQGEATEAPTTATTTTMTTQISTWFQSLFSSSTATAANTTQQTSRSVTATATTAAESAAEDKARTAETTQKDTTHHHCYLCEDEEKKSSLSNTKLHLRVGDQKVNPELYYQRRRYKMNGRCLEFLQDDEWVMPWTKGVTTEYTVRFVSFNDPQQEQVKPQTVCGTCIRSKHADLWQAIKDRNSHYV